MSSNQQPWRPAGTGLLRSFGYAVAGLLHALRHERNLRIDFAAGAWVLYLTRYYAFSRLELAFIALLIGFVIVCEMLNTAIENTVDLETPGYHRLARIAKDVAAGAVLVAAVCSVAAGYFLFWDSVVLGRIWADVSANPLVWLLAAGCTVGLVFFPWGRK